MSSDTKLIGKDATGATTPANSTSLRPESNEDVPDQDSAKSLQKQKLSFILPSRAILGYSLVFPLMALLAPARNLACWYGWHDRLSHVWAHFPDAGAGATFEEGGRRPHNSNDGWRVQVVNYTGELKNNGFLAPAGQEIQHGPKVENACGGKC